MFRCSSPFNDFVLSQNSCLGKASSFILTRARIEMFVGGISVVEQKLR